MLTIEYAKNPIYANQEHTVINLMVKFAEFDEELPFTAVSDDIHNHGVELFNRAMAGEFGPISDYVEFRTNPEIGTVPPEQQPSTTGSQNL